MTQFFVGLQRPSTAFAFACSMLSINVLRNRKRGFSANEWLLDSAAFTEMSTYGNWRTSSVEYAAQIDRLRINGIFRGAVSQDFMCEPSILQRTGLTVRDHQRLTVERYAQLLELTDAYIMPVLQGFTPDSYAAHICEYAGLLQPGQWVGVGSVCKRNGNPHQIEDVLLAIKSERPDLRLHGFGIKLGALRSVTVRSLLYSADSMAWTYAGRRKRDGSEHDPRLALAYAAKVEPLLNQPLLVQQQLFRRQLPTQDDAPGTLCDPSTGLWPLYKSL
jgi:hypothetical protein